MCTSGVSKLCSATAHLIFCDRSQHSWQFWRRLLESDLLTISALQQTESLILCSSAPAVLAYHQHCALCMCRKACSQHPVTSAPVGAGPQHHLDEWMSGALVSILGAGEGAKLCRARGGLGLGGVKNGGSLCHRILFSLLGQAARHRPYQFCPHSIAGAKMHWCCIPCSKGANASLPQGDSQQFTSILRIHHISGTGAVGTGKLRIRLP